MTSLMKMIKCSIMRKQHLSILAAMLMHHSGRLYDFHCSALGVTLDDVRWLSFRKYITRRSQPKTGIFWILAPRGKRVLRGDVSA